MGKFTPGRNRKQAPLQLPPTALEEIPLELLMPCRRQLVELGAQLGHLLLEPGLILLRHVLLRFRHAFLHFKPPYAAVRSTLTTYSNRHAVPRRVTYPCRF